MKRFLTIALTLLVAVLTVAPPAAAQVIDLERIVEDVNRATSVSKSTASSATVHFAHVAGQYEAALVPVEDDQADTFTQLAVLLNALRAPFCTSTTRSADCEGWNVSPYVYCTVDLDVIYSYYRPLGQPSTDLVNETEAGFDCPSTVDGQAMDYPGGATVTARAYIKDAGVPAAGGVQDILCPGPSRTFGWCTGPYSTSGPSASSWVGADLSVPVAIAANQNGIPEAHGVGSAYDWATIFSIDIPQMGQFDFCAAASEVDSVGEIDVKWYTAQEAANLPYVNPCAVF